MQRRVITVDGHAGSGKTSLSRLLAQKINYLHFSSGLLYRAIGFLSLRHGVDPMDADALTELIKKHQLQLSDEAGSAKVLIDGQDVSSQLHTPEVSEATSKSSQHQKVRAALIDAQRLAFPGRNLVVEGRDTGTVIFPDADLKFFIEAGTEVRVRRRIVQLYGQETLDNPELLQGVKRPIEIEILERDKRDSGRALAPTKAAADAIIIDNSAEKLTNVLQSMYDAAANRGLV